MNDEEHWLISSYIVLFPQKFRFIDFSGMIPEYVSWLILPVGQVKRISL